MIKSILTTALIFGASLSAQAQETQQMIKTNLPEVYQTGELNNLAPKMQMHAGLYIVGDEDNRMSGTHYLLIDRYTNDGSQFIALLMSQGTVKHDMIGMTNIYLGKYIRGGTSVMLSPIWINNNGSLIVDSEVNEKSQVLEISAISDSKQRYPYMVKGHYGALGGRVMGMRAARYNQLPQFTGWPSSGMYEGVTNGARLALQGGQIEILNSSSMAGSYSVIPLNGQAGRIAGLTATTLNTMAETDVSSSKIQKLVFFITGLDQREIVLVAEPKVGGFWTEAFSPERRSLLDIFFPGRR